MLALLLLPVLLVALLIQVLWEGGLALMDAYRDHRERKVARAEAELDAKALELRATMLQLSEALSTSAHETRKAMIRESFLASGRVPNSKD